METFPVKTNKKSEFVDITTAVQQIVLKSKVKKGVCIVHCPHTTAGLTINENSDPCVPADMLRKLGELVPENDSYTHLEANSEAHIKASMMGFSLTILVENGELVLGTWQGIYFCEFDGPRDRKVQVKIIEV